MRLNKLTEDDWLRTEHPPNETTKENINSTIKRKDFLIK